MHASANTSKFTRLDMGTHNNKYDDCRAFSSSLVLENIVIGDTSFSPSYGSTEKLNQNINLI